MAHGTRGALLLIALVLVASEDAPFTKAKKRTKLVTEIVRKSDACTETVEEFHYLIVNYNASLGKDGLGTEFASAGKGTSKPFEFQIGAQPSHVIKGWNEGLIGMCAGEKRRLVVPPELGYGKHGAGELVPPESWLTFDVELLSMTDKPSKKFKGPPESDLFTEIDTKFGDADGEISVKEITRWFEAQNGHKNGKDLQLEGLIKIFLADDKNENGKVDWGEFSGPKSVSPPILEDPGEYEL